MKKLTSVDYRVLSRAEIAQLAQIERAETSASIPSLYKISVGLQTRISELFGRY